MASVKAVATKKPSALKPQDVVVGARLALLTGTWSYDRLATELGMSTETVHSAVKRLVAARLFNLVRRRVIREQFLEFLQHGVRFAFPASASSRVVRGVATGVSAPPLAAKILAGDEAALVWPAQDGTAKGRAVTPLHNGVPKAATQLPELHEVLALIDAVRIGTAREREIANEELRKRLS